MSQRNKELEDIQRPLFISAFIIATCGLVYELVAGAMASYLVGDSVTHFSLIIGVYLSSMGVGAYASQYFERNLLARFVEIEIIIALIGGLEALLLFAAFAYTTSFHIVLYGLVSVVGMMVGMEIPLLIRILEAKSDLKALVARVFFLDYIGALAASLAFPLVLAPALGLLRTSLLFGLMNGAVALWTTFIFGSKSSQMKRLRFMATVTLALLLGIFAGARWIEQKIETDLFADPIVYKSTSPYQKLTLTHAGNDTRLFINGALQFSSLDEHRYHESLVHPAMSLHSTAQRAVVMGGGDGMAVRELLRYPNLKEIVLIELDPMMIELFRDKDDLAKLNEFALRDKRVRIVIDDAFTWLRESKEGNFDIAIIDFPDPNNFSLGKLYTTHFYRLLKRALTEDGIVSIQSTSPMFSPRAFWCIAETLRYEDYSVRPFHAYVPSFGEWGFIVASPKELPQWGELPSSLEYLTAELLETLTVFPIDMQVDLDEIPINRLDNQTLVRLYEEDWTRMHR